MLISKRLFKTALGLFLLLSVSIEYAFARDEYLGWWGDEYGVSSSSDDAVCQLCHERGGGGDGWNRYGWLLRIEYLNSSDIPDLEQRLRTSLRQIEDSFSDPNDAGSPTFEQEILANAQPGWRVGGVNTIRFRGGAPDKVISPPATLPCALLLDQFSDERTCSTSNPIPTSIMSAGPSIALETVADGFSAPVSAISAPGEPESIYVLEQGGNVWRVNLETGDKEMFLDFSAKLVANYGVPIPSFPGYDERGFLGMAFHPQYASNGKIFTYISENYQAGAAHFSTINIGSDPDPDHMSVVSEWVVTNPQSSSAQATSERRLLIVDQPQFNHNGGMLKFGPDGYLYISFGDGGGANDAGNGHGTDGNGRDVSNPLGSIVRIDINATMPINGRYTVPDNNPFVGTLGLDEIYVYGLRNPYRFSFEELPDDSFNLYIGDVGQDAIEELDRVHSMSPGGNYGWNYKEGSFFFSVIDGLTYVSENPPSGVDLPALIDPIAEYDHGEGISVIGGYVYNGTKIPALRGKYVFGDWGRSFGSPDGRLFFLNDADQMREFIVDHPIGLHVTGFGQDHSGELYVVGSEGFTVTSQTGALKRLVNGEQEICIPIKAKNGAVSLICL